MRRLFVGRCVPAAAACLIVALLAGGGYALAVDGGRITACVGKGSGDLYVGRCAKGDRTLSWSKTGPRGPRGPAGPPGPSRPLGASPSDTSSYAQNNLFVPISNIPGTTVLSTVINLASPQTINATASLEAVSTVGSADDVGCDMTIDNQGSPFTLGDTSTLPGANSATSLTNAGSVANVPSGSHTISLICFQTGGPAGDATVGNENLLAWTTG